MLLLFTGIILHGAILSFIARLFTAFFEYASLPFVINFVLYILQSLDDSIADVYKEHWMWLNCYENLAEPSSTEYLKCRQMVNRLELKCELRHFLSLACVPTAGRHMPDFLKLFYEKCVCMHACMYVCMHACMYVQYASISVCLSTPTWTNLLLKAWKQPVYKK